MKYSVKYINYAFKNKFCEYPSCGDYAGLPHHIKSRGAGGSEEHDNLISFCAEHHQEVHTTGWRTFCEGLSIEPKFCKAMGVEL